MGILDELRHAVEGPLNAGVGMINGVKDGVSLVGNVVDGDWHGVADDGLKLMGDVADVAEGLASLGFNVGPTPTALDNSRLSNPADSKILAAAQWTIGGMKLTTGSGTPTNGDEFWKSSEHLTDVVKTLSYANPHGDRWDGTAAQVYNAVNSTHLHFVGIVQDADVNVASVLDEEAEQVQNARDLLDGASEGLTDYDLATCWLNFCGPEGKALKMALDIAAAGLALQTCGVTMAVLLGESLANSTKIQAELEKYEDAARDTTGDPSSCEVFPIPDAGHPLPDVGLGRRSRLPDVNAPTKPPTRSLPDTKYTVPDPEDPPAFGPPATPLGAPASAPGGAASGSTPAAPARPAVTPAPAPPAPAPAPAARAGNPGERAPIEAGKPALQPDSTPRHS